MKYDCIIIGGGASGLMLAAQLNMNNRKGLILESGSRLGSKLIMSGGGHCNITHAGSIKDFIPAYGSSGRSLRKCLYQHNNAELITWLEDNGISTTASDEGRVFPASMKSIDVLNFLVNKAKENEWEILLDSRVSDISRLNDAWKITVVTSGNSDQQELILTTDIIVIASGGITYPKTGSDGSMFEILKGINRNDGSPLEITELRSALAPIYVDNYPYSELSGVSIPDVTVAVQACENGIVCGKQLKMEGSILFTHEGFSGPAILNISGNARKGSKLIIRYNKKLDELPKRMRHILEARARGSSGDIKTGKLLSLLENDEFTISSISDKGMVTRGGIALHQINLGTMEVVSLENYDKQASPKLYVIGEAIDADGITGGYNLQLCYSTAVSAADAIEDFLKIK